jgi:hypothetical protein
VHAGPCWPITNAANVCRNHVESNRGTWSESTRLMVTPEMCAVLLSPRCRFSWIAKCFMSTCRERSVGQFAFTMAALFSSFSNCLPDEGKPSLMRMDHKYLEILAVCAAAMNSLKPCATALGIGEYRGSRETFHLA